MQTTLLVVQSILSVLIIVAILLQSSSGGFGAIGSGGGETFHTRRGLEKVLFYATIVLTVLFALTSLSISLI